MNSLKLTGLILGCVGLLALGAGDAFAAEFLYMRVGNTADSAPVAPRAGFALMGGGDDLDEAFRWLCERASGGDFLVLRATGDDEYNSYVQKLCHLNSVATVVIPTRTAANDPELARIIGHAGALFISGGDQANYINFWTGTPVQAALNDAIRRGVPIGGTSAGLAVMGEWAYSAQGDKPDDPDLNSRSALDSPYHNARITLVHGFLQIPILQGVLTDTHFAKRDRMGRLLVFLARLAQPDCKASPTSAPAVRGLGVEERAAVLLEPDGKAAVVGKGSAYFIATHDAGGPPCQTQPMTFGPYAIAKVAPGHRFDVNAWRGDAVMYTVRVKDGVVQSSQAGGAIY